MRIDAVLDEFSDRLERIALRECDDPYGVPIIATAQLAAVLTLGFHSGQRLVIWIHACHFARGGTSCEISRKMTRESRENSA